MTVRAADAPPARVPAIAVVRGDEAPLTRLLTEMVMLDLAESDAVQVVDRESLDQIWDEHHLALSGLSDPATQIQLGRLLGADALAVLAVDHRLRQMTVRLIECGRGFVVGHDRHPVSGRPRDEVARDIAAGVIQSARKLRSDPEEQILVSLLRVGNHTLLRDMDWTEEYMPPLLEAGMLGDPRVRVIERRMLGWIMKDPGLSSAAGDFRGAGVMMDGELALDAGQNINDPGAAVTLHVRLRDSGQNLIGQTATAGTLDRIDELCARAVPQVLAALREMAPRGSSDAAAESRYFYQLAMQHDYFWAAEIARLLEPTNAIIARKYADLLLKRVRFPPDAQFLSPFEQALAIREALDILETIYTPAQFDYLLCGIIARQEVMIGLPSKTNPEISEILRPIRRKIRDAVERSERTILSRYGRVPLGFSETEEDFLNYFRDLFRKHLNAEPITDEDRRVLAGMRDVSHNRVIFRHLSPEYREKWIVMLEQIATHPDVLSRLIAYSLLRQVVYSISYWANAMAMSEKAIEQGKLFNIIGILHELFETARNVGPEKDDARAQKYIAVLSMKATDWMINLIRSNQVELITKVSPETILDKLLLQKDAVRFCAALLSWKEQNWDATHKESDGLQSYFSAVRETYDRLVSPYPEETVHVSGYPGINSTENREGPNLGGRVLFGADQVDYQELNEKVNELWGGDKLLPLEVIRYYLHENRLWVLAVRTRQVYMRDGSYGYDYKEGFGIVEIDVSNGRFLRRQFVSKPIRVSPHLPVYVQPCGDWVFVGFQSGVYGVNMDAPLGTQHETIQGLPSTELVGLASSDRHLYIGLLSLLARWDIETRETTLVWNVDSELSAPTIRSGKRVIGSITGHYPLEHLYVLIGYTQSDGDVLMRMDISNNEWSVAADPVQFRHPGILVSQPRRVISAHQCIELAQNRGFPWKSMILDPQNAHAGRRLEHLRNHQLQRLERIADAVKKADIEDTNAVQARYESIGRYHFDPRTGELLAKYDGISPWEQSIVIEDGNVIQYAPAEAEMP